MTAENIKRAITSARDLLFALKDVDAEIFDKADEQVCGRLLTSYCALEDALKGFPEDGAL